MAKEFGIDAIVSKATFARVLSCVSRKEASGAILGVLRMRFGTVGEVIAVEGKTATADAMHCQREACRRIIQRKGDYLFGWDTQQRQLLCAAKFERKRYVLGKRKNLIFIVDKPQGFW